MKCINCPYHSRLSSQDWCDIGKKSKRISPTDATKDVPCSKYDKKQLRENK